jgi:preprotein translocase, YajC subunit
MDPITIGMLVILALLIFFMFRSSRKRQKQASELQEKVVPGAEVMTNFGLYGTILSIDTENNKVELDAGHGVVLTVHRQTVTRVVEPTEETAAVEESAPATEPELNTDHAIRDEPQYGERTDRTGRKASDDDTDGKSDA